MDGGPDFFHYFPMSSSRHPLHHSPAGGFLARIELRDPSFPLATRRIKPLHVEYAYLHRHPEFELCYFPRDAGTFMIQDREYPIRAGDIFVVNANDLHQPILDSRRNDGAVVVYFSPRLFSDSVESAEWLNAFILASLVGGNRLGRHPGLAALIVQLHDAISARQPHWQLACRGLLIHALSIVACEFLKRHGATHPRGLPAVHRFARVVEYINEHLHTRISGRELYRLGALSHSQFCSRFRATFGMSVSTYIRMQRLRRAMRLLQSTPLTVTQIALQTGFTSSSFFSTAFRRHAGMSPANYRKMALGLHGGSRRDSPAGLPPAP